VPEFEFGLEKVAAQPVDCAGAQFAGADRLRAGTNQAQPPLFRPIATDVRAEKRFLSTIARRLDTLGAITRGQRQTGGQGLFRAEDNLESVYGRAALRQLSISCSMPGKSRAVRSKPSKPRPGSAWLMPTAACARNSRRSRPSSIACWR